MYLYRTIRPRPVRPEARNRPLPHYAYEGRALRTRKARTDSQLSLEPVASMLPRSEGYCSFFSLLFPFSWLLICHELDPKNDVAKMLAR